MNYLQNNDFFSFPVRNIFITDFFGKYYHQGLSYVHRPLKLRGLWLCPIDVSLGNIPTQFKNSELFSKKIPHLLHLYVSAFLPSLFSCVSVYKPYHTHPERPQHTERMLCRVSRFPSRVQSPLLSRRRSLWTVL